MSYKFYIIILFFVFVGCDRTELDFSNTLNEKNEIVGESITLKNLEYKNLIKNELTNIKVYSIDSSLQRGYYIKDIDYNFFDTVQIQGKFSSDFLSLRLKEKLKNKEQIRIGALGTSITSGAHTLDHYYNNSDKDTYPYLISKMLKYRNLIMCFSISIFCISKYWNSNYQISVR